MSPGKKEKLKRSNKNVQPKSKRIKTVVWSISDFSDHVLENPEKQDASTDTTVIVSQTNQPKAIVSVCDDDGELEVIPISNPQPEVCNRPQNKLQMIDNEKCLSEDNFMFDADVNLTLGKANFPTDVNAILSQIDELKAIVSSFSNNMQQHLEQLKDTAIGFTSVPFLEVTFPKASIPKSGNELVPVVSATVSKSENPINEVQISKVPITEVEKNVLLTVEADIPNVLKSIIDNPIANSKEFETLETGFKKNKEIKDALITYLSNFDLPNEKKFMTAVIDELFTRDFFIDKITWKIEPNRVLLRNTEILKCWKESYAKKYGKAKSDDFFMTHCRLYKQSFRKKAKQAK